MNHEVGHVLGLIHSFEGANGCSDASAPRSSSNNVMDYRQGNALSPCQLEVAHSTLINSSNSTIDFSRYLATGSCNAIPPRAFFRPVWMPDGSGFALDARGTFDAQAITIRIYQYSPESYEGKGALLCSENRFDSWQMQPLQDFGRCSTLSTGQLYWVELTASKDGMQHTYGQPVQWGSYGVGTP